MRFSLVTGTACVVEWLDSFDPVVFRCIIYSICNSSEFLGLTKKKVITYINSSFLTVKSKYFDIFFIYLIPIK